MTVNPALVFRGEVQFASVPELVEAMKHLAEAKFAKLMASLNSPMGRRVRTNNHVERTNRLLRSFERVRYRWRRRRMVVRFPVLKPDEIWRGKMPPETEPFESEGSDRRPQTQPGARQRSSRAA